MRGLKGKVAIVAGAYVNGQAILVDGGANFT
jgi:hypothetical protein